MTERLNAVYAAQERQFLGSTNMACLIGLYCSTIDMLVMAAENLPDEASRRLMKSTVDMATENRRLGEYVFDNRCEAVYTELKEAFKQLPNAAPKI